MTDSVMTASGMTDSGMTDSGVTDSGMTDSGVTASVPTAILAGSEESAVPGRAGGVWGQCENQTGVLIQVNGVK